ncbi:hypothetical protein Tco_0581333 [Tanacetum coccineum]
MYAYGDVRSKNQDLLMVISDLKDKLKTFEKGKGVNTKFDKSMISGKLLCVESSNSVRRPKSKDTKIKDRVLKNTIDKSAFVHVRNISSSVSIESNKHETMNLTKHQSKASVLNTKTVNAVNDGLNIICVSCRKDVFMLSHEKCVSRYALSRDSRVKRALFHYPRTVRFKNDHIAAITRYGDYVQGNLTICHVYYVEGLGHKLFLVGQFCDEDLEVAFHSNTCYVRNLEGYDLLTSSREFNLYTISISDLAASSLNFFGPKPLLLLALFRIALLYTLGTTRLLMSLFEEENPMFNTLNVFRSLCYLTNDREDLGKMKPKADTDSDAPQIVTSLDEPITQQSSIPVLETHSDEQIQEDVAELDGNTIMHSFEILEFEEATPTHSN